MLLSHFGKYELLMVSQSASKVINPFNFRLKFDQTAELTPCDFFNFRLKFDKTAGLAPCDFFFNLRPNLVW